MKPIGILNGPNLNWLGKREPELYGTKTWKALFADLKNHAEEQGRPLLDFQSNSEGKLIDTLQEWSEKVSGVVFNPGAFAHTSIALRDCVAMLEVPVVEVHVTNIRRREAFRRHSHIAEEAEASIMGFGVQGYLLGLKFLLYLAKGETPRMTHVAYDPTQQRQNP